MSAGPGDGLPPDVRPGWGPGWQETAVSRVVGHGGRAFARVRSGLLGWDVQRLAGVTVPVTTPPVAPDVLVRQTVGPGGLLVALCRVSEVVDEPRRAGFTYAALHPHPEEGEETFLVEHRADDGRPDHHVELAPGLGAGTCREPDGTPRPAGRRPPLPARRAAAGALTGHLCRGRPVRRGAVRGPGDGQSP